MEAVIAGLLAAGLTFCELDRTFYVPPKVGYKVHVLRAAFLLGNGLLAVALYLLVDADGSIDSVNRWIRAALVGAGYLGLVRLKLVTIPVQSGDGVPFGFEYFYEEMKGAVYRRVNRIAGKARRDQALAYAAPRTLGALGLEARLTVTNDQLMLPERKTEMLAWVLELIENPGESDVEERAALADFILSGLPPHHLA